MALVATVSTRAAGAAQADPDLGLTTNQRRLLYLISQYSRPARTNVEKEEWVRRPALMVLIYECIVAPSPGFDYDYAAVSLLVHGQRVYFNLSQEGSSDLDLLREEGLVNGLKLSSAAYTPVSCLQISAKGNDLLKRVSRTDRDAINAVILPPGSRDPVRVLWRAGRYLLVGDKGYERASTVTDVEDVSYVGSAYIPQCLRFGGRPTLSNAHRAAECAKAASNIRDVLDEVITLNSVSLIVAEFIPFGANNLAQVNANVGAGERVPGGLFSALVDDDADGTKLLVEPGLTSVNVLDHSHTRHINFEADIYLPEAKGIVQVETLGVAMNADGCIMYGMQVEAVMDRIKDNLSLDQLARVLVDVSMDSSTIVDSILSAYQRRLMGVVYPGVNGTSGREKLYLVIANEITPHLTAEEYMDKGDYENELKQVVGETRAAFDISEHDTLVFGAHGLLLAGPNARLHEPLLCSYVQFMSMDLFVRNFFARTFLINDAMKELRRVINHHTTEPLAVAGMNLKLQSLSDDVRMLGETLSFVVESLEACEIPAPPADVPGRALFQRLQIADVAAQLSLRVIDLKKLFDGIKAEMQHLQQLSRSVHDSRAQAVQEASVSLLRQLLGQNETGERIAASAQMLLMIAAGILAFHVLDRLTGDWTVINSPWMQDFATPVITKYPLTWFIINMLFWLLLVFLCLRTLYLLTFATQGTTSVHVRVMQPIILERFYVYLQSKITSIEDRAYDERNTLIRVSWEEPALVVKQHFGGSTPRVTVEYDKTTSFMHSIRIDYNRRMARKNTALSAMQLRDFLSRDLTEAGVFVVKSYRFSDDPTSEIVSTPTASARVARRKKGTSSAKVAVVPPTSPSPKPK